MTYKKQLRVLAAVLIVSGSSSAFAAEYDASLVACTSVHFEIKNKTDTGLTVDGRYLCDLTPAGCATVKRIQAQALAKHQKLDVDNIACTIKAVKSYADLVAENASLRHELAACNAVPKSNQAISNSQTKQLQEIVDSQNNANTDTTTAAPANK